ncbi:MAG: hypothetical protein V3T04_02760 [Dehalococcoidia bacterium]
MNVPGVREPTGGSATESAALLPARGGMNPATAIAGHASAKAVSTDGRGRPARPTTRGRSDLVGVCAMVVRVVGLNCHLHPPGCAPGKSGPK